jgi:GNAT superfamily N-acetyltransferase
MTDKTYYSRHHDVIEQLLDKSVVLVATTNEEPDVILGWACYEQGVGNESCGLPPVIHYVYVKPSFRKCGIATKLLDGLDLAGAFYSHETFMLKIEKIQKKLATCQFDPYSSMSTRRRSYERKD